MLLHCRPTSNTEKEFYDWLVKLDPDTDENLTVVAIKDKIRERDGYKCVQCGMTNEEHQKQFDTILHVHRMVPGTTYGSNWFCVTLCQTCHGKKPKRTEDGFWATDLRWFGFNLLNPDHRELWQAMVAYCREYGISPNELIAKAVRGHLDNEPVNYCI